MSTLIRSAAEILADVEAHPQYAPYDDPDWLTPGQVMAMLGLTRGQLDRAGLPWLKTLGGHRRYRLADVQTYHPTAQG